MTTTSSYFFATIGYQQGSDCKNFLAHVDYSETNIRYLEKMNADHWNGENMLSDEDIAQVRRSLVSLYKKRDDCIGKISLALPFSRYRRVID
jgi:hypothetical protein